MRLGVLAALCLPLLTGPGQAGGLAPDSGTPGDDTQITLVTPDADRFVQSGRGGAPLSP